MEERVARIALVAVLLVLGLPRPGYSRPCTCDDIDDLKASLAMIDQTRKAWYAVLAEAGDVVFRGRVSSSAHAPKNMEEAAQLFQEKMGWTSVRKVGGLNSKGDVVIDPEYEKEHCDSEVKGVRVHENAHFWYFVARSIPIAMSSPRELARILAKSEIDARDEQERFLNGELRALMKRCGREYTSQPRTPTRIQGTH
jgi:hypothetical protein